MSNKKNSNKNMLLDIYISCFKQFIPNANKSYLNYFVNPYHTSSADAIS